MAFEDDVRTFRISTNTLGAGFVEAIANETLLAIRDRQPAAMRGTAMLVPVLEANSAARIGRFGWKSQHASLESFSADAYLNEMGITTPLFPDENTSSRPRRRLRRLRHGGRSRGRRRGRGGVRELHALDEGAAARTDHGRRRAPARSCSHSVGCNACHVASIITAPPGTRINGGAFAVPQRRSATRSSIPYSDFLLHDIGTGDGIPVQPTPEFAATATQIRTAPLWALRTRNRLMHDGLSFTKEEAIARHAGQATAVRQRFDALTATQKRLLLQFLDSL